jgi:hypothetical protein
MGHGITEGGTRIRHSRFVGATARRGIGSRLFGRRRRDSRQSLNAVLETFAGKGATDIVQAAAFASIRDQIVCIDDIERKGKDLRTMDVLGLVSLLPEHRLCKVVLILNDERGHDVMNELRREMLSFDNCKG